MASLPTLTRRDMSSTPYRSKACNARFTGVQKMEKLNRENPLDMRIQSCAQGRERVGV